MLVVVASLAMGLALLTAYVRSAAVDSDQFANRATAALRDESVRTLIAERVTDQIVLRQASDLIAVRPLIQSVVSSTVGGRAFTGLFRAAVRDVHRALFDRDQNTLTLTVADIGTIVAAGLQVVRPSLARQVEKTGAVEIVSRDIGTFSAEAARAARTVRLLAIVFLLIAVISVAGALVLSRDRRQTVVDLGIGTAAVGVLLVVALGIGRRVAIDQVHGPDARAAAGAVWDAFLHDLSTAAWILAASGAVIAAAAASLIRPIDLGEPLRRLGRAAVREPASPALKALRGVGLVGAGLVLILDRDAVLRLLFTLAGLYLVYAGVTAVLWLVYQPRKKEARRKQPSERRRTISAALVAGVLVVVAVAAFAGSGGTTTAAPAAGACEGHIALCGRPFDEVALPATHNAMSVPLPGWFASEQDRPIADQLHDGIRGLLIDTHYADRLPNGRLRTEIGDTHKINADGISPSAVDAALRIRDRLGFSGKGKRGMYLCHTFCEIGGTSLASVLRDLHDFLIANPGEIVVVINQDYVTPEDYVAAVRKAGLEKLAYRGPTASGQWPTLRQMISTNQRAVFLAENHAGAAPWYQLAYKSITEETPYAFNKKTALLTDPSKRPASCRPNRGPEGAPLFLVNHWISTDPIPLPSDAAKVNAYAPLLGRMKECQRLRGHLPNLVAVNFYRRGDVFRVVDTLNGIP